MLLHGKEETILPTLPAGVFPISVPWDAGLAERHRGRSVDGILDVPGRGDSSGIGTMVEQQTNDGWVSRRPHEGSLPEFRSPRVHVRPAIQQQLDDVHLSEPGSRHEWRFTVLSSDIWIRAVL